MFRKDLPAAIGENGSGGSGGVAKVEDRRPCR